MNFLIFPKYLSIFILLSIACMSFNTSFATDSSSAPTSAPTGKASSDKTTIKNDQSVKKQHNLASLLKLTPDQAGEIDAIRRSFNERYQPELERYQAKVEAFQQLNEKALQKGLQKDLTVQRKALHQDTVAMESLYRQLDDQIKNVLTLKQAKRFERLRKHWRHDFRHQVYGEP